jgi:16S rRNA (cytosine1402-N4)-methyltransferase
MSHIPVLLKEVINGLSVKDGDVVVDMTLGNAGHSKVILEDNAKNLTLVGIDADKIAIEEAQKNLSGNSQKVILENSYFDSIGEILEKNSISKIDKVLFDLGFRSDQIDSPERGFSIQKDGPLDMSFAKGAKITAKTIVNEWEEELLANIIYGFGEEGFSRRIAKAIVEAREIKPIETTTELAEIIKSSVPAFYRRGKIHPATKTFQALRITVNKELERLEKALPIVFSKLSAGGRIAVISFHSLEDRIVKNFFREKAKNGEAILLTKKPITATREEIIENPRSRSAKLRILEKNDN